MAMAALLLLGSASFSVAAAGGGGAAAAEAATAVERFRAYLRIPTVHPDPDYGPAAEFLLKQGAEVGLGAEVLELVPGKPVVLLTWEGLEKGLPSVLLNSHMDVVPAEEGKWEYDPFGAAKDGAGNIYARGSQDMKCVGMQPALVRSLLRSQSIMALLPFSGPLPPLLAYLEAIRALKVEGFVPRRSVHVSFVPDEEIGGVDGMGKLVESARFRDINVGVLLDEGLASPTDSYRIFYGERSPWWLVIKAAGQPAHGSKAFDGSAMENLLKSVEVVMRYRSSQFDLVKAGMAAEGEVVSVNPVFLKAGHPTPTGFVMNLQPSEAEAGFDMRLPPMADMAAMERRIAEEWAPTSRNMTYTVISMLGSFVLKEYVANSDAAPSCTLCQFKQKVGTLDKNGRPQLTLRNGSDPWWGLCMGAVSRAGAGVAEPEIFPAATDSRYLRYLGTPAVGFSPMRRTPVLLHDHNEVLIVCGSLRYNLQPPPLLTLLAGRHVVAAIDDWHVQAVVATALLPFLAAPVLLRGRNKFLNEHVFLEGIGIYKAIIQAFAEFEGPPLEEHLRISAACGPPPTPTRSLPPPSSSRAHSLTEAHRCRARRWRTELGASMWRHGGGAHLAASSAAVVAAVISMAAAAASAAAAADGGAIPGEDLLWWVQVSDLHVGGASPAAVARAADLEAHLGPALAVIRPSLLLLTGDLTDARGKGMGTPRQDEGEWSRYRTAVARLAAACSLPEHLVLDLRGNHDTYGVPKRRGPRDFFARHSCAARWHNGSEVYSVTMEKKYFAARLAPICTLQAKLSHAGRLHHFVGLDSAPSIGIRPPVNFFGHPEDRHLDLLQMELAAETERFGNAASPGEHRNVTTLVFAHYPLAFTANTPCGRRLVDTVAEGGKIAGFVSGHLHTKFGTQLFRLHRRRGGTFWEWVAGDWKDSRAIRVMAADDGLVSFVDIRLLQRVRSAKWQSIAAWSWWVLQWWRSSEPADAVGLLKRTDAMEQGGIILVTSPPDCRFHSVTIGRASNEVNVRALVFSKHGHLRVMATVHADAGAAPAPAPLASQELTSSNSGGDGKGPLYVGTMVLPAQEAQKLDSEAILYLVVTATDSRNATFAAEPRALRWAGCGGSGGSSTKQNCQLVQTWVERVMVGTDWEVAWPLACRGAFGVLLATTLLPWVLLALLISSDAHDRFTSWLLDDRLLPLQPAALLLWALVESASDDAVVAGQLLYAAYLALLPWFWGRFLGNGQPVGTLSIWGISLSDPSNRRNGLFTPDILTVTVPWLYGAVLPSAYWLVALAAERSLARRWQRPLESCRKQEGGHSHSPTTGQVIRRSGSNGGLVADVGQRRRATAVAAAAASYSTSAELKLEDVAKTRLRAPGRERSRVTLRLLRVALCLSALVILAFILQQVKGLAQAYGWWAVIASPGVAWLPAYLTFAAAWKLSKHT
eukprot:SM000111S18783  [mRNA]  locus=s111:91567:99835:- [translate_table: standard]